MNKKMTKNIVDEVKNYEDAKKVFGKLSAVELIDLKASLKGGGVHFDKWVTIIIPFISIALAVLALINSTKCSSSQLVVNDGVILLIIASIILGIHMLEKMKHEKYIATLCYLEEYSEEKKEYDINCFNFVEKMEEKKKQNLERLIKTRDYINEEVKRIWDLEE